MKNQVYFDAVELAPFSSREYGGGDVESRMQELQRAAHIETEFIGGVPTLTPSDTFLFSHSREKNIRFRVYFISKLILKSFRLCWHSNTVFILKKGSRNLSVTLVESNFFIIWKHKAYYEVISCQPLLVSLSLRAFYGHRRK